MRHYPKVTRKHRKSIVNLSLYVAEQIKQDQKSRQRKPARRRSRG